MSDSFVATFLVNAWYQKSKWLYLLWPISFLFRCLVGLRRLLYQIGILKSWKAPIPVIVVGNINVGGTGKTPLVVALVRALQVQGLNPAIVSRGYTSKAPSYPFHVTETSTPEEAGDEPLLLAIRAKVPVVIGPDRVSAVRSLLKLHACDVVVCDDGLQHYALSRDIELVVLDGQRMFGNRLCLPAGPLREPTSRVQSCDFIVGNGEISEPLETDVAAFIMQLLPVGFEPVINKDGAGLVDLSRWNCSKHVHAVAGIGHPERFFTMLREMGFTVIEHAFGDHYQYRADDIRFSDELPVIMTEKDAVKVRKLGQDLSPEKYWYMPINAVMDRDLFTVIADRIKGLLVN
jgi:tetraacyldisaccharide 4'-kinase